ncbi:MAG: hypothetical protein IIA50_00990 [Bacteroidetes bacterium]|nr:hypothetical protein [Bacteroidota bacterium]
MAKKLVQKYGDQVRTYADEWERLVRRPVKEIGFWSVHESIWQSVIKDLDN